VILQWMGSVTMPEFKPLFAAIPLTKPWTITPWARVSSRMADHGQVFRNKCRERESNPQGSLCEPRDFKSLAEMPGAQSSLLLCDLAALREIFIRHTVTPILCSE